MNGNGIIEATAASGSQVEVRVERTARAGSDEDARALLQGLNMEVEASPQRVKLGTRGSDGEGGHRRMLSRSGMTLRYHVRVPAGVDASFETANGGIKLADLRGRVSATTTNGGVTGERLSGAVTATA